MTAEEQRSILHHQTYLYVSRLVDGRCRRFIIYIDSLDLCLVQEHWLHNDHLYKIRDISPDFLSVSVSAMDNSVLLSGRPYGGCSKSLGMCITPLISCSDRFCGVKLCDSSGLSFLIVCVYMPAQCSSTSTDEYLNTLGELEGFISTQQCDVNIIIGDFNVDFDRGGSLARLLSDFMSEHNLSTFPQPCSIYL